MNKFTAATLLALSIAGCHSSKSKTLTSTTSSRSWTYRYVAPALRVRFVTFTTSTAKGLTTNLHGDEVGDDIRANHFHEEVKTECVEMVVAVDDTKRITETSVHCAVAQKKNLDTGEIIDTWPTTSSILFRHATDGTVKTAMPKDLAPKRATEYGRLYATSLTAPHWSKLLHGKTLEVGKIIPVDLAIAGQIIGETNLIRVEEATVELLPHSPLHRVVLRAKSSSEYKLTATITADFNDDGVLMATAVDSVVNADDEKTKFEFEVTFHANSTRTIE